MKVKICGITNLDDALAACDAGADLLGFNFAEEARRKNRYIAPEEAREIVGQLPPFVMTVAVTVNDSVENAREYLSFLDYVQLHGDESPAHCAAVGRRAVKAFRAGGNFAPESVVPYAAAAYLLDACVPGAVGGTGVTCDWELAARVVALGRPVMLAGGLTPENVAEAVRRVRPYAVDTAGGVESAPGKKDHGKLREFVRQAKHALSFSG